MKRVPYMIVSAVLIFGSSISYFARTYAQSSGLQPLPGHSPEGFAGAENRWRLSAVNLKTEDDLVDPAVRAARNAFWTPKATEYDAAQSKGIEIHAPLARYSTTESEISTNPASIWVIASFDSYRVLSPNPTSHFLYTEVQFGIRSVVWQPKTSHLSTGDVVDIGLAGGRAVRADDTIDTVEISPERYSIQPGHTYLLQLTPASPGGFFLLSKQWEVSSGKIVADRGDEVQRVALGQSKLIGLSIDDAASYIRSLLPASNN